MEKGRSKTRGKLGVVKIATSLFQDVSKVCVFFLKCLNSYKKCTFSLISYEYLFKFTLHDDVFSKLCFLCFFIIDDLSTFSRPAWWCQDGDEENILFLTFGELGRNMSKTASSTYLFFVYNIIWETKLSFAKPFWSTVCLCTPDKHPFILVGWYGFPTHGWWYSPIFCISMH